jgi:membrane protease YdiL (CAAX protease family)
VRLSSRAWDWAELWIGYCLILIVIWTPGRWQEILYWVAFAWVAVTGWLRRKETRPNGLGLRGIVASLWIVGAAVLIALAGIGLAGRLHTLHRLYGVMPVANHLAGYALWALMQQFILQVYVLLRLLRRGLNRGAALALAAAMFSVAHIPNPVLVPATLLWALIACPLYLRYRNLYALAVAHGILGMCLAVTIPNSINRHMRVGLGYVQYHRHGLGGRPTQR